MAFPDILPVALSHRCNVIYYDNLQMIQVPKHLPSSPKTQRENLCLPLTNLTFPPTLMGGKVRYCAVLYCVCGNMITRNNLGMWILRSQYRLK